MFRHAGRFLLLYGMVAGPLAAQTWIGVDVGGVRTWGASASPDPEGAEARPYRHTSYGARIAFGGRGFRWGVGLRYADMGLLAEVSPPQGVSVGLIVSGQFTTFALQATGSIPILSLTETVHLRALAGAQVEGWTLDGGDAIRTRIGPIGGASLEVDLGRRWRLSATGEVSVIASPLRQDEVGDELRTTALWRRSLYGGVSFKL